MTLPGSLAAFLIYYTLHLNEARDCASEGKAGVLSAAHVSHAYFQACARPSNVTEFGLLGGSDLALLSICRDRPLPLDFVFHLLRYSAEQCLRVRLCGAHKKAVVLVQYVYQGNQAACLVLAFEDGNLVHYNSVVFARKSNIVWNAQCHVTQVIKVEPRHPLPGVAVRNHNIAPHLHGQLVVS